MIDINLIRQDPDIVKKNVVRRGKRELISIIDELIKNDVSYRKHKIQAEKLLEENNLEPIIEITDDEISNEIIKIDKQNKQNKQVK